MILKRLLPDDHAMVFLAVLEGVVRKGGARQEVGSRARGCQIVHCAEQVSQALHLHTYFISISCVELLPPTLHDTHTPRSLQCRIPLASDILAGMMPTFPMCLNRRRSNLPTLYLWTTFPPL